AWIERRLAADEPELVDRLLARVGDLEIELLGPAAAAALVLAERVAGLVDHLQRRLQVGVELALLDQPATQLVDDRRLLDPDRADLDAGVALHARPDGLGAHAVLADHRRLKAVAVGAPVHERPEHAANADRGERPI